MAFRSKGKVLSIVALAAAAQAPFAVGQSSSDVLKLDEVVVTSRKVEERLQDVPLSIKAFGGEQIEREGISRIEDVARLVPGLTGRQAHARTTPRPQEPRLGGEAKPTPGRR